MVGVSHQLGDGCLMCLVCFVHQQESTRAASYAALRWISYFWEEEVKAAFPHREPLHDPTAPDYDLHINFPGCGDNVSGGEVC